MKLPTKYEFNRKLSVYIEYTTNATIERKLKIDEKFQPPTLNVTLNPLNRSNPLNTYSMSIAHTELPVGTLFWKYMYFIPCGNSEVS